MDGPQVFKSTFKALINEDYFVSSDINRYQGVLEHTLSKGMHMLPSNLNLSMEKTRGYNNKTLISDTVMNTGSNKDINNVHKKLLVTPQGPGTKNG